MPARRVLFVDDNVDSAQSYKVLLSYHGHIVEFVPGPDHVMDVVLQFRPEFIFLDIGMPRINGWQVARGLRADDRTRDLRIFALTAYDAPEDYLRSKEAGFDGHLVKPVETTLLLKILGDGEH